MSEAGSGYLVIGRISGVYGIKGWVKILSWTEPMENLLAYGSWRVQRQPGWEDIAIDAGRRHGKGLVAHIDGVDDRDAALALKGLEIAVPAAVLPKLEEGAYYWRELEGVSVYSNGELLGQVDHLLETGANDVLVVKPCVGSRDERERLIPWLPDTVVQQVDLGADRIMVDWDPEF